MLYNVLIDAEIQGTDSSFTVFFVSRVHPDLDSCLVVIVAGGGVFNNL
jgi:hypothetical protein